MTDKHTNRCRIYRSRYVQELHMRRVTKKEDVNAQTVQQTTVFRVKSSIQTVSLSFVPGNSLPDILSNTPFQNFSPDSERIFQDQFLIVIFQ